MKLLQYVEGGERGGGYEKDYYADFGGNAAVSKYQYPDAVAKFIIHLYKAINNRDTAEIENLYEIRFPQLTKDYFKEEKWPSDISHLVDEPLFVTLYRELYFRHIYAALPQSLTFSDRCNSYSNYCELFNMILSKNWLKYLCLAYNVVQCVICKIIIVFVIDSLPGAD